MEKLFAMYTKISLRFLATLFLIITIAVSCSKSESNPTDNQPDPEPDPDPIGVQGELNIYPSPGANLSTVEHLKQSDDYTVEVRRKGETSYQTCFVYKTDNYWTDRYFGGDPRPQSTASFTSFAFKGTAVDVKVTYKSAANTVTIRPLNFGINAVRSGNSVSFTIEDPKKISVEISNRLNPLFIFAEEPDIPNTAATYYYGPGVHKIGLAKIINSNESVYIAAGAVVEGSFRLPYNTRNISLKGRGVISMGEWPHESTEVPWLGDHSGVRANGTSFLQMEGLIFTNNTGWTIPIYNSDNLTHDNQFRNIKMVSWNGNTDGIWVNGNNHIIDDCFLFINDDIFMSHGATNCKISNIVAWGGPWGRLYWLSNQKSTSNMTFENINLIGKDGGPAVILVDGASGTNMSVNNITFRNLRIESHPKTSNYNTNKFLVFNSGYKSVGNWLFENVTIDDKNVDEGDLYGTATSPVNGITFRNLKMAGVKMTSLSQANMDANGFATNIVFE